MSRSINTVVVLLLLIVVEIVFVAFTTGYLFIQLRSPVFENLGFFLSLAGDDFFSTLKIIFIEKPLFVIQSQHKTTGSTIWSLHYYSLTLLVHLGLAYVMVELRYRFGKQIKYDARYLGGVLLIATSTLYLFLGSCCTGGPSWIVQTWLLAIVFNPVTSTNATIKFYQSIKDSFVILQLLGGGLGVYLLLGYWKRSSRRAGYAHQQTAH